MENKDGRLFRIRLSPLALKGVLLPSLAVWIVSLAAIIWTEAGYSTNRNVLAEAQQLHRTSVETAVSPSSAEPRVQPSFLSLLDQNPDMVGWLKIEDTPIDYPIVQTSDNEYYLHHNYKREASKAGNLFMDFRNGFIVPSRHTILYGHQMKDGTQFGQLNKFADPDFFQSHRFIQYDTLYKTYKMEVFSIYFTTTAFDYIQTDFSDNEAYGAFLNQIQSLSLYPSDVSLTAEDKIVTLSTCDGRLDTNEGRFVVHAKLIE